MAPPDRAPYETAREVIDNAMSERQLLVRVIALAKLYRWHVYHTWLSAHSAAGWPDVIAVKGGRMLALELKSERGRVTGPQQQWLDALALVPGVTAFVWRPHDWDGEIVRILGG